MKTELLIMFLLCAVSVFVITVIAAKILIPKLKSRKVGQKILDIGPRWHKSKEGTPTMGGITFIIAILAVSLVYLIILGINGELSDAVPLILTLGMALANGLIGLIDDYTKLIKKQNEGLTAKQKYLLQLLASGIYLVLMKVLGYISTSLYIPYFGVELELGIFYYVFALVLITGVINSVNLTDGIDGLASSVTFVVGAFFAVAAFASLDADLAFVSAVMIGGTLGFLVYNFYPARIFMGDTGSLFLGGLVIGTVFMIGNPLIVCVVGLLYILEAVSVMLQVGCFKLTGKRIFKMSPIHHHFEKCGWSEVKIVTVFTLFTAVMAVAAWFGLNF